MSWASIQWFSNWEVPSTCAGCVIVIKLLLISMTEPAFIPQLDLFHSRRHRHPLCDHIETHLHHHIPSYQPYVHPPPSSYASSKLAAELPLPISHNSIDYVKAPSTYLDYAEDYLATGQLHKPLRQPHSSTTNKFYCSPYESKMGRKKCECELPQQVSKDVYTKKNTTQTPIVKKQTTDANESLPQRHVYQKANNDTPSKSPYLQFQTEREEPNKMPESKVDPLSMLFNPNAITENESVIEKSNIQKHQQAGKKEEGKKEEGKPVVNLSLNISQPKAETATKETQTGTVQTVNRSSVLIEKLFRKIPQMLDDQTFRRLVREQTEEFNNIKIEFEEEPPTIDFDDLIETKGTRFVIVDQYMEFSRELLFRLERLAGEKNELFLVAKLFEEKKKKGILWPEI